MSRNVESMECVCLDVSFMMMGAWLMALQGPGGAYCYDSMLRFILLACF